MFKAILRLFPIKYKNRVRKKLYEIVKDSDSTTYFGQFAEDALIQTYFKNKAWNESRNLDIKKDGFYIDIGAYSPSALSNTYWFYNRGWTGITLDPTPGVKEAFDKIRPNDINLHLAIANQDGFLKLYSWGNSVLNTLSEEEVNRVRLANKEFRPPDVTVVPAMKLSSLLDRYLPTGQKIDFISIDVEGKDYEVLQSNDWHKYRPELIVIELHAGRMEEVLISDIYKFLADKNYQLIYWIQPSLIFKDLAVP